MRCQETSGFLTLHQCENQATRKCKYCKKKICDEHAKPIGDLVGAGAGGAGSSGSADVASMPSGQADIPGMTPDLDDYEGEVACVQCMKKRFAEPAAQGLDNRKTRWFRRHYYYDPYFYGHYHGYRPHGVRHDYDEQDYEAFEDDADTDVDDLEDS